MIVYEVNIEVDAGVADAYRDWLRGHVAQMLALPGFTGAEVFEVVVAPPDPRQQSLCVHYRLRDQAALDEYLREHAPRMRADGVARFGDRFRASRRVLRAG
jgi:quinol monooxygenase YgiN